MALGLTTAKTLVSVYQLHAPLAPTNPNTCGTNLKKITISSYGLSFLARVHSNENFVLLVMNHAPPVSIVFSFLV